MENPFRLVLAGNLGSPSVISFNLEIDFAPNREKIRLPIVEVLLRAAAGNLVHSKKQRDWQSCNAVLLPPFLTKTLCTNIETSVEALLKIFSKRINK